jgi:hypothetical protein
MPLTPTSLRLLDVEPSDIPPDLEKAAYMDALPVQVMTKIVFR